MKTILFSLIIAMLIVGQVYTPAAAVSCGTTYIVQNQDTLAKIAELCGTTVDDLLDLNPQIANPNLIYNGQELLIRGRRPSAIRVTYTSTSPTTYTVKEGDTFLDIANQYGITIWEIVKANSGLTFFSKLTEGMKINIPAAKITTSYTMYVKNTYVVYNANARVTVSTTTARPGDDIHIYVSDFPAGALIDYQISVIDITNIYVYDGVVDENGNASLTFEIPASANDNEAWIVYVRTTSQAKEVHATSPRIMIDY